MTVLSTQTPCALSLHGWAGQQERFGLLSHFASVAGADSESILTVTVPEDYHDDLAKRVAITSSIYPDPNTHIETVTYGDDGDSMHCSTPCWSATARASRAR